MSNSENFTEESDDADTMETEEGYERRKYRGCRQMQPEERQSCRDLMYCDCCCERAQNYELQEHERRPRRRTKSQARRWASCNHPQEPWKHSMERPDIFNDVNDTLKFYQHCLAKANNRTSKKLQNMYHCDGAMPGAYLHPGKRQISLHRRSCRSEQNPVMLSTIDNGIDFDASPRACYQHEQFVKNIHNRNVEETDCPSDDHLGRNQTITKAPENLEMRRLFLENHTQHNKERSSKTGVWTSRQQHADKTSKFETSVKKQFRFDLPDNENSNEMNPKNVEENQENQTRRNPNALPNKPFATKGKSKPSGLQISTRDKNLEDSKNLTMERSLEEDARKELEDRSVNKPRKPSTIRQSFRFKDEVTFGNRKENREDASCELMVKNEEEEENSVRKNIYAGGDLELHATKSHILGLIDRAISKEFGNLTDQQQNLDSNPGLAGQDICIQIMRVLQGNCCQTLAEDVLGHRDLSVDCIKLLKMIRWDHMAHIQKEFKRLCSLQKFLDTYSPRQSFPAFQSHPVEVEQQRSDERQPQQHEEKQNSGTIP